VSSLLNKNFLVRTLSGAGLLVIVLGAVLWSPFSMLVLMAVLMAGSLTEFFRIARLKGARPLVAYPVVIGLSALTLAFAVQTGRCPAPAFALLLPMIFALFVAELYRRHENPLGNVCWELGGLVYIALRIARPGVQAVQPPDGHSAQNAPGEAFPRLFRGNFRLCVFRYICLYLCAERRPGRSRCRLNQTITHENP